MSKPTYQELEVELYFERIKNEYLMRSFSKPSGLITTDGGVKWTPFSVDTGKQVEKLGYVEHSLYSVALVLIGIIIGFVCK